VTRGRTRLKNSLSTALLLLTIAPIVFGFSATARNTLEYRAAQANKGNNFFEDRFDLRLNISKITLGARFEAMHPSDSTALTRPDTTYTDITQYWADLKHDVISITVGSFTSTLGAGLLLDARELRDVKQDHHLDGANVNFNHRFCNATILSGIAGWDNDTRFRGGELQVNAPYIPAGCGYIRYDVPKASLETGPGLTGETWEIRALPVYGPFSAEVHYAKTWRSDADFGTNLNGETVYATASLFIGPVTVFGEFLSADSFLVKGATQESYVTLPLIVRQPSYTLMSRHLSEPNPRDVIAYNAEAAITPLDNLDLTIALANLDHPEKAMDYIEIFGSVYQELGDLTVRGIYEYQKTGEQEPVHNAVLEPLYYFSNRTSLLFDIEFQAGEEYDEKYSNFYGLSELSISPYGAIGIEGGRLMEWDRESESLEPEYSIRLYIDGEIAENHKITLAFGKRPGGFTCSGGTCRFEPAFEGFELKLSSSF